MSYDFLLVRTSLMEWNVYTVNEMTVMSKLALESSWEFSALHAELDVICLPEDNDDVLWCVSCGDRWCSWRWRSWGLGLLMCVLFLLWSRSRFSGV